MSIDSTAELVNVNSSGQLHFIVSGFLARYPQRTRDVYRGHLKQWITYLADHHVDPLAVKRAHIEAWARHLTEERHLKPATVAAKLNAVCGLYKYAAIDGHIPLNPGAHVRRPKIQFMSKTQGLSRPQLADLLAAAEKDGPMTFALLCLLALSGLRISETLAANVEDLGHERGFRTIHLPNRKGGKISTLSLSVQAAWAIDQIVGLRTSGPILLGLIRKNSSPISRKNSPMIPSTTAHEGVRRSTCSRSG